MIKKIEELDYYEILNLGNDPSPKDIENAYLLAVATYHEESLASYGVLMDRERAVILDKVEAAFQTLRDPKKREAYDAKVRNRRLEIRQKASFRTSSKRLLIEDASERETPWDKIKSIFDPFRRRGATPSPDKPGRGKDLPDLLEDFYYYGDFLKKIRQRRGLSLEDIAEKCDVDPLELRSLEEETPGPGSNGEKHLDLLRCYARCLGLNPENGQDSPFSTRFH